MNLLARLAPLHGSDLVVYAAKSLIVVAVVLVGFRLLGKREAAQLNVYDLAMLMALSNVVQNAMTGGRGNLPIGLVTSSTVVLAAWVLGRLLYRRPSLAHRLLGSPTILVSRGRVLHARMRRERVTDDELAAALREHGLEGPAQARLVVLERDGTLSVVPEG